MTSWRLKKEAFGRNAFSNWGNRLHRTFSFVCVPSIQSGREYFCRYTHFVVYSTQTTRRGSFVSRLLAGTDCYRPCRPTCKDKYRGWRLKVQCLQLCIRAAVWEVVWALSPRPTSLRGRICDFSDKHDLLRKHGTDGAPRASAFTTYSCYAHARSHCAGSCALVRTWATNEQCVLALLFFFRGAIRLKDL